MEVRGAMINPNVAQIVKAYLVEHGYDGIYAEDECACLIDDLMPCGEPCDRCIAGYKAPCDCGDHEYHIQDRGPDPETRESVINQ